MPEPWVIVAILTLMGCCYLMSLLPDEHEACRETHRAEVKREAAARTVEQETQLHAFHDRFRPQPSCRLCQAPRDE